MILGGGDPWRREARESFSCRGTGTHRIERPGERNDPVESHQTTRGERRDGRLADGRRSAPASDGTMLIPGRGIRRASRDRTVAPFAGIALLARHARCLRGDGVKVEPGAARSGADDRMLTRKYLNEARPNGQTILSLADVNLDPKIFLNYQQK